MAQSALTAEHLQKLMEEVIAKRDKVFAMPRSLITDKCMGAGIGALGAGGGGGVVGYDYGAHGHSADAMNYAAQSIAGGHTHSFSGAAQTSTIDRWSETHLYDMLASRMGWDSDKRCPFRRMLPFRVTPEKVSIFVVAGDDALVLSDEALMYPSDALITQVRLLAEAL